MDIGVVEAPGGGLAAEEFLAIAIKEAGFVKQRSKKLDFLNYRYIVDIDGYANAWDGLFTAMLMGATVFKVASPYGFRQWYYDKLVPWQNYIPVSADLNDLDDRIDWALSHPDDCADMGHSLADLAKQMSYEREFLRSAEVVRQMFANQPSHAFLVG